jgi:hypothetical protein
MDDKRRQIKHSRIRRDQSKKKPAAGRFNFVRETIIQKKQMLYSSLHSHQSYLLV